MENLKGHFTNKQASNTKLKQKPAILLYLPVHDSMIMIA